MQRSDLCTPSQNNPLRRLRALIATTRPRRTTGIILRESTQ